MLKVYLSLALLASSALGHGFVSSIRVADVTYPGAYTNDSALHSGIFNNITMAARQAPSDKGWTVMPTLPEMACGSAGTAVSGAAAASIDINGGDVITITITGSPAKAFFHTPCTIAIDMANCQGNCATVDASTLNWFRLESDGYANGQWIMETVQLATNYRTDGSGAGPEYSFIVPQSLVSGNYMLRYETNCFWQAYNFQQVQPLAPAYPEFYPWCTQVVLTSPGTVSPTGQLITTYYQDSDFSTLPRLPNDTAAIQAWRLPGPAVTTFTETPAATVNTYSAATDAQYFSYSGTGWSNLGVATNHYNGQANTCSNDPSASFAFAFTGTGFTYVTSLGSDRGPFDIYIDGQKLEGTAFSASAESAYGSVYAQSNMVLATHTINITQNAASAGAYLCNDAINIAGSLVNGTRLPVLFSANTNTLPTVTAPTNSTTTDSGHPNATSSASKSNLGAIIGGAVGGGLGALLILLIAFFCWRRNKKNKAKHAPLGRDEILDTEEGTMKYIHTTPFMVTSPTNQMSNAPHPDENVMVPVLPASPVAHEIVTRSNSSEGSDVLSDESHRYSSMTAALTEKGRLAADEEERDRRASLGSAQTRRSLPIAPGAVGTSSSMPTHEEDAGEASEHHTLPPMYETAIASRRPQSS